MPAGPIPWASTYPVTKEGSGPCGTDFVTPGAADGSATALRKLVEYTGLRFKLRQVPRQPQDRSEEPTFYSYFLHDSAHLLNCRSKPDEYRFPDKEVTDIEFPHLGKRRDGPDRVVGQPMTHMHFKIQ